LLGTEDISQSKCEYRVLTNIRTFKWISSVPFIGAVLYTASLQHRPLSNVGYNPSSTGILVKILKLSNKNV
jgi:hypothetical protein